MARLNNIPVIGKAVLHEDYELFFKFFRNVWVKPHTYVVLIARRCFNLNEIFMRVQRSMGGIVANDDRLISNNALLLYSSEIADYYQTWGCFPSILLVDDLTYHGRGIARLLYSLQELIISRLENQRQTPLTGDDRYYIQRDLAAAVDIYVFGVNRQPLLIDDLYLKGLQAETLRYTSELRNLSQRLSCFIQQIGIPNTSYVLSCSCNLSQPVNFRSDGGFSRDWSYQSGRQLMFLRVRSTDRGLLSVIPTVRMCGFSPDSSISNLQITGLAIFDEISKDDLGQICEKILEQLPHIFKTISNILLLDHPMHQKAKGQFLSFLLSAVCLNFFFEDMELAPKNICFTEDNTDIKKIARNFGRVSSVLPELRMIFARTTLWDNLRRQIYDEFSKKAVPFFDCSRHGKMPETDNANDVVPKADRFFYNVGMESEESAWQKVEGRKRFSPEQPGTDMIPLRKYMNSMEAPQYPAAVSAVCMLSRMDSGLVSMNVEPSAGTGEETLQCVLKAGELATFVLPRYYYLFISALARVEQNCQWVRMNRRAAVIRFIQSLPEDPPDVTAAQANASLLEQERFALKALKSSSGTDFIDRLYECGQSLKDWDIDWITDDDQQNYSSIRRYFSFVIHNMTWQQVYIKLADAFLQGM